MKRGGGNRAAPAGGARIAGLAVLLGLLPLAVARGDEVSTLQADRQQLQQLQQQLDQLQGIPRPAAGVSGQPATAPDQPPVTGGSFPRSFLVPGTNTSVSISGSVQTNFGERISH